ncbi:hypothetical protein ACIGFK_07430 [Streptomyces sp. NPDC085524]|uniref:hypothetical protein n=1 Tax=unclassified Streptomyces TaxID=2593676 RepID=UPI0035DDFDC4
MTADPPQPPEAVVHDAVALWASAQATALGGGDAPAYGDPAWRALAAADPRRTVAILAAAEQWRRHAAREAWLDHLLSTDPDRWYAVVTADANAHARTITGDLARRPTLAELRARRERAEPARACPVAASPGWPPVAVPGRPGSWRHRLADGRQADLAHNQPQEPPRDHAPHRTRTGGRSTGAA